MFIKPSLLRGWPKVGVSFLWFIQAI